MIQIGSTPWLTLVAALLIIPVHSRAEDEGNAEGKKSLDPVLQVGGQLWQTKLDVFQKHFESHGFEWLSASHAGLRSVDPDLEMFGEKVGETIVRSDEGIIHRVDISVFNRGDQGSLTGSDFKNTLERWQGYVTSATDTRPEEAKSASDAAVGLKRVLWYTADSAILLESSVSRNGPEFIRLRLAPKPKGAFYLGNTTGRVRQQVFRGDLRQNVTRQGDGDVVIKGVPMVDQGPKGYCAVASAERVFRYYGLETDQHEMAQLASSSSAGGTSQRMMYDALKTASTGVQLRVYDIIQFETKDFFDWIEAYNREAKKEGVSLAPDDPRRIVYLDQVYEALDPAVYLKVKSSRGNFFSGFKDDVIENIEAGVPLMWGVYLGLYPEKDIPQARGGHMRLIIGYNRQKEELIYSDSWGAGHEAKRMPMNQAFAMTTGLYTVKPAR
ncbi:MAG: C39 family peptidase [Verrucomicrobiae bacterium]|nr:C39 family peptidase [Verrucomicrobiae bacterium]